MTYSGTTLTGTQTTDRAILDLLKKINEIAESPEVVITGIDSDGKPIKSVLSWNTNEGTIDATLENGVTGQMFQELHFYGIAAENIENGDLVMFGGIDQTNNQILFKKNDALATGYVPEWIVGIATQAISIGTRGYVTWFGRVHDVHTTGFSVGDILYADPTTPGGLTNTEPGPEYYLSQICVVEKASYNSLENGTLLVRPHLHIPHLESVMQDPTGFDRPENVIVTYNSASRTITLTGTFQGYWQGAAVRELTTGWTSPAHPVGPTAPLFLYYDGTSFQWSTSSWTFPMLQIAFLNCDAGGVRFGLRETHGMMQWMTHQELHQTVGTYLTSGGDVTVTLLSTTAANRRPTISATTIKDEDNPTDLLAHTTKNNYTQFYLTGTNTINWTTGAADFPLLATAQPYWNQWSGSAWQQTLMSNNSWMSYWLVAAPATADTASQNYRYFWVQGQSNGTLAQEQAASFNQLNLGTLTTATPELIAIAQLIIRYQSSNWDVVEYNKLTGTRANQISTGSGFLSAVATDTTLSGNGTAGDPLKLSGTYTGTFNVTGTTDSVIKATGKASTLAAIDIQGGNANAAMELRLLDGASSTNRNWAIGANVITNGNFEIIPSTAANGTTFSTPALRIVGGNGNVSIGSAARGSGKLTVNGPINVGTSGATLGQVYIEGDYGTNQALPIWGSEQDSGGALMGYGAKNSGVVDTFKSTTSIAVARNAYVQNGNGHNFWVGASQTVAVDGALTMSKAMVIDTAGKVGIGITPTSDLHIEKAVAGAVSTTVKNTTTTGYANITARADTASLMIEAVGSAFSGGTNMGISQVNAANIQAGNSSGLLISTSNSSPIVLGTNSTERMRIDSTGKVGIGTSSISAPLHVKSTGVLARFETTAATGSNEMDFYSGSTLQGYIGYASSGNNLFYLNNTLGNFIVNVGNFGIGGDPGTNKLRVVGPSYMENDSTTQSLVLTLKNPNTTSNTTRTTAIAFKGTDTTGTAKSAAIIEAYTGAVNWLTAGLKFNVRTSDTDTLATSLTLSPDGLATFPNTVIAGGFQGPGTNLTNLPAGNLTGTIPVGVAGGSGLSVPAGNLTGTTLKSTVVTSSLTSVGTLTNLNTNNMPTVATVDIIASAISTDKGYIKYSDGTQICWGAVNVPTVALSNNNIGTYGWSFYSGTTSVTLPLTFYNTDYSHMNTSAQMGPSGYYGATYCAVNNTSTITVGAAFYANVSFTLFWTVRGRWKI